MSQGGLSGLGLPKSKQHFSSEVDGETGKQSAATMYFLYDGLRTASGLGVTPVRRHLLQDLDTKWGTGIALRWAYTPNFRFFDIQGNTREICFVFNKMS